MLILQRKNIVISMLIVLLIVTGYLNFAYNQKMLNKDSAEIMASDMNGDMNSEKSEEPKVTINDVSEDAYGSEISEDDNAKDVSTVTSKGSFFANYRIERENTRKQEIEVIREIIDNPNSDADMKKEAQAQLLEIANNMEKELLIEGLIKAKGFEDTIVVMSQNSVNVIVGRAELKPEEVAQILDIVRRESGKSTDSIKIIPMI